VITLSAYKHEIAGSTIWPQVHLHLKMGGYWWGDNSIEEVTSKPNEQWSELNKNSCIDKIKNTSNQISPVACYFIFFIK
jgi:hypothetical protein